MSPLVIIEAGLCFGAVGIWWLIGTWALGDALFHSGTEPALAVDVIALGGAGLAGVVLLAHAASSGVRHVWAWFVLVPCLACGFFALPEWRGRFAVDIWFLYLPALGTIHLLLVAVRRTRANRSASMQPRPLRRSR